MKQSEIKEKIAFIENYLRNKGLEVSIVKRHDVYLVKITKHYPFFIKWDTLLEIIDLLEAEGFSVTHITAGRKGIILRTVPEFYELD